jgi:multicomponent Na+:H+ antiporter subunit C
VSAHLPYAVAVWIFAVGIYGVVRSRHLIHSILCLGVAQASTYVLLLAIGVKRPGVAPIFSAHVPVGTPAVDPVMHALTLTDIVVGAGVDALLLAMTVQVARRRKTADPARLRPMSG